MMIIIGPIIIIVNNYGVAQVPEQTEQPHTPEQDERVKTFLSPAQLWKPTPGHVQVHCDTCSWQSEYKTVPSAKMGLGSHKRWCKQRKPLTFT
jgi:hypothetical protein